MIAALSRSIGGRPVKALSHILARFLFCTAIFAIVQGHIAVVQLYAWGEMLAERSSERGFVEAAVSVASGDEPCSLCHAIAETTRTESAPDQRAPEPVKEPALPKLIALDGDRAVLPPLTASGRLPILRDNERALSWCERTPVPPPQIEI